MKDEPLLDVVVEMILFLELSDEQTVCEDAAMNMMEQIAARLQQLDLAGKQHFLQYTQWRAERTESASQREIIANLGMNLGLVSN